MKRAFIAKILGTISDKPVFLLVLLRQYEDKFMTAIAINSY
jgi:hypothetical protein